MKKLLTFMSILLASTHLSAKCCGYNDFNPYIGAEAQLRHMDFKKDYGGNILKHNSPQRNFYAGIRPTKHFGIEVGYEATNSNPHTEILRGGDIVNGVQIPTVFSSVTFKTKSKFKGPHLSMIGFYQPSKDMPFEVFSSIGLSLMKGTVERHTAYINGMAINTMRLMSHRKPILRFMVGAEHLLNNHIGARISAGLSKTSKMNICANDGICSKVVPTVQPKDNIIYGYGLGLFYKF